MDRLNQLRATAGSSRDSTLDTSSPPSEGFTTANESSSKYYSLSEVDSTFDISPIKEVNLTAAPESDELISNLSPIGKKADLSDYKIGKQIEAANILSGGVDIFEDNDNSNDGDGLVIDDNAGMDDEKSLDSSMIPFPKDEGLVDAEIGIPSKETGVALQIDGKNVDAIDIGNGLYLYRKEGQEELAAVQIVEDSQQQPTFKFLKVRENADGNLEVYEEIEVEVPKETLVKEKKTSHVPVKNISKVINDDVDKASDKKSRIPIKDTTAVSAKKEEPAVNNETPDGKSEVNFNGKMMKFSEARKSPLIGSFTPMTFHSTPNKDGIPLTKTMVDQHLHPSRHSDNVKKTIEVHTDTCKSKLFDTHSKNNSSTEETKIPEDSSLIENDTQNVDKKEANTEENLVRGETKVEEIIIDDSKSSENETQTNIESVALPVSENKSIKNPDQSPLQEVSIKCDEINANLNAETIEDSEHVNDTEKTDDGDNKKIVIDNSSDTLLLNVEKSDDEQLEIDIEEKTPKKDLLDEKSENSIVPPASNQILESQPTESIIPMPEKEVVLPDKIDMDNINQVKIQQENIKNKDNFAPDSEKTEVMEDLEKLTPAIIEPVKNDASMASSESVTTKIPEKEGILEKNTVCQEDNLGVDITAAVHNTNETDVKVRDTETKINLPTSSIIQTELIVKPVTKETDIELKVLPEKNINSTSNLIDSVVKQNHHEQTIDSTKATDLLLSKQGDLLKQETKENQQEITLSLNKSEGLTGYDKQAKSTNSSIHNMAETNIDKEKLHDSLKIEKTPTDKNTTTPQSEQNSQIADTKPENHDVLCKPIPSDSIKSEELIKKDLPKIESNSELPQKYINNNHAPVPFGKWTEANRQAFLNKIKEAKVPTNSATANQIKQTKDLNSRDVLKKMETQRQSNIAIAKAAEIAKATEISRVSDASKVAELDKVKEVLMVADEIKVLDMIKTSKVTKATVKECQLPKSVEITKVIEKANQTHIPRASASNMPNTNIKNESSLPNRPTVTESKRSIKSERFESKYRIDKKLPKQEIKKNQSELTLRQTASMEADVAKTENLQRKAYNNQDLIDKTIEGIINRAVCGKVTDDTKQSDVKDKGSHTLKKIYPHTKPDDPASLDAIEMKMNELHGIPFIERPPHELPKLSNKESKLFVKSDQKLTKTDNIPKLLPLSNKGIQKPTKANVIDVDSEEEIIEHEPITGDIDIKKNYGHLTQRQKSLNPQVTHSTQINNDKKEAIITEKDFDKFARRNSISYENCLTVNLGKETHNVVQTVVQKDNMTVKNYSRNKTLLAEAKARSPQKYSSYQPATYATNVALASKAHLIHDGLQMRVGNPSKVQMAYQSLTSKRQVDNPITIIEDKPVKVVFMDSRTDYIPRKLDVQGKELSPVKKSVLESDSPAISAGDSLDSDMYDNINDEKTTDGTKIKVKHQRKQVLTPVDNPDLELIEPADLGIETSPKKKRRIEEKPKNISNKKSYLLSHNNVVADNNAKIQTIDHKPYKEQHDQKPTIMHNNAASAIDSLVMAAELLENRSESMNASVLSNSIISSHDSSENQQSTPIKRGRGRPRKYPLPDGTPDKSKAPSPQKKPRLIDAKKKKVETSSEDDFSDEEMIRENWTMGKINEKIVCPICNKLFRSENVVFKHVKHCTGPSPSRSGSDNRSPRRSRQSQESENYSQSSKSDIDLDDEPLTTVQQNIRRKSKEDSPVKPLQDDVVVIEDTPVKEKPEAPKEHVSRKPAVKTKPQVEVDSLECEFCGKKFRQLSYLVSHKMQHKTEKEVKKSEVVAPVTSSSVFSCDVCKKEFRKLHHLVQHRVIHNPPSVMPPKAQRKISSEQTEAKKPVETAQQNEDTSAGFRCEPCDKSFRKLHHLVEHRETHDGINRQKHTPAVVPVAEKPAPPPQCEICKKSFRKLHHLIEHKEQHESHSEKGSEKSKASLATNDIIHECNLCYMVFPNEQSLNKHHGNCLKKKRQSALKQNKLENEEPELDDKTSKIDIDKVDDPVVVVEAENENEKEKQEESSQPLIEVKTSAEQATIRVQSTEETPKEPEIKANDIKPVVNTQTLESSKPKTLEIISDIPANSKKEEKLVAAAQEAQKKKTPVKEKVPLKVTKREKSTSRRLTNESSKSNKPASNVDTSDDDDEVRYMLNPDFKPEENVEAKLFMNVRATKRSSLQIERPSSKDLVKRRTSLQHPPKIPRLKTKPIEVKPTCRTISEEKAIVKPKHEPAPSTNTDSDDSDVKYSFPKPADKPQKPTAQNVVPKEAEKKVIRKSMAEKRKSLSAVARRKTLGNAATSKPALSAAVPVVKEIKRRTAIVEHRCDCGQLFGSAALLSRHTTLAHTPPRRRRRSPAPAPAPAPTNTRKSTVPKTTTKSPANSKTPVEKKKATEAKTASKSSAKPRRNAAHRGVPPPEKMRKLMEKFTK